MILKIHQSESVIIIAQKQSSGVLVSSRNENAKSLHNFCIYISVYEKAS